MQYYGYARKSNYNNLMNGKEKIEFMIFPNTSLHTMKYEERSAIISFVKIFDKYIYHPNFGSELGKFFLNLLKYEPLKPPRNDFVSILISDYFVDSKDFMLSLIRLLKIWFINDDLKNVLIEKFKNAVFSDKVKMNAIDAVIYESFILMELPEFKDIKIELLEHFSKVENNKDTILNMSDPNRVKNTIRKIKKEKLFYTKNINVDGYCFSLTNYNKFLLKIIYDFLHSYNSRHVMDFYYYENPLWMYMDSVEELQGDGDLKDLEEVNL